MAIKVRFNESIMGERFVYGRGQIAVLTESEAKYWIDKGYAIRIEDDPELKQIDPVVQEIKVPKQKVVRRKNEI